MVNNKQWTLSCVPSGVWKSLFYVTSIINEVWYWKNIDNTFLMIQLLKNVIVSTCNKAIYTLSYPILNLTIWFIFYELSTKLWHIIYIFYLISSDYLRCEWSRDLKQVVIIKLWLFNHSKLNYIKNKTTLGKNINKNKVKLVPKQAHLVKLCCTWIQINKPN